MQPTWYATTVSNNVTHTSASANSVGHGQTEDEGGTSGVRVPRRPVQPFNSSGDALDLPRASDPSPSFLHVI